MATLMIKCPQTHKAVPIGFVDSREAFDTDPTLFRHLPLFPANRRRAEPIDYTPTDQPGGLVRCRALLGLSLWMDYGWGLGSFGSTESPDEVKDCQRDRASARLLPDAP